MNSLNIPTGGALARFKGLAWVFGAVALLFAVIFLAPIISHSF
jgi:hypothetical protein